MKKRIRFFPKLNPYTLFGNISILYLIVLVLNSCNSHIKVSLLNEDNMNGWYSYLEKHGRNNDQDSVFTIHNGILRISGKEFGYLCTAKSYADFRLTIDFNF